MRAVKFSQTGGPEVLQMQDVEVGAPEAGQVRLRQTAVGLNYIDTYHRSGLYPMPLPSGIGLEACGVVEELGQGVTGLQVGDRVAYGAGPIGAYAEMRNISAHKITKLPDSIDDETAAGMMLKGMTVRYLLRATYKVSAGETILFHAAAGGVGLIACQWANALGATVIGTAGSEEKMAQAKAHGCAHVINYNTQDVAKEVREITDGKGVPVVYDGVGQATLMASLDSLQPRGMLVSFGNASGPVDSFDTGLLAAKGSLYLTRPSLMAYVGTEAELQETTADLMAMIASRKVKIPVNQRYELKDAVKAHQDLESRKTTGSSVFVV